MRFATDARGTFTDIVIEDDGNVHPFRSPTVPNNSVAGVLGAFKIKHFRAD
jgi:N-methylhydantoinase A